MSPTTQATLLEAAENGAAALGAAIQIVDSLPMDLHTKVAFKATLQKQLEKLTCAVLDARDEYDPTPACHRCAAKTSSECKCDPFAENE